MGFYYLDLDELSQYMNVPVTKLKAKSYDELEKLISDMKQEKILRQNRQNAEDEKYSRLVLKYFEPVRLLRHWFSDKEIVLACAMSGLMERDLCMEQHVAPGMKPYWKDADYLRRSFESVVQYDRWGRELAERKREERDVYRVANKFQGTRHGDVILWLLYTRYPELKQFGFRAYSMDSTKDYEIYPRNGIYISLTALLSGDVDWILYRNRSYCKSYNKGRYSPNECEKAFKTEEAREMFRLIRQIGKQERALGHLPHTEMDNGRFLSANGLMETDFMDQFRLLQEQMDQNILRHDPNKRIRYKIEDGTSRTVRELLDFWKEVMKPENAVIHIANNKDSLCENAVTLQIRNGKMDQVDQQLLDEKLSDNVMAGVFGHYRNTDHDLTIRVQAP